MTQPWQTPTCNTCGTQWRQSGNRTGHCSGCHRTFSGIAAFDAHQTVPEGRIVCRDPGTLTTHSGAAKWRTYRDECGALVWRSAVELPEGAFS